MTVGRKAQYDGEIKNLFSGPPTAATLINQPMRMSRSNYLVNNINHINDQRSQVVACWLPDNTGAGRGISMAYQAGGAQPANGAIISITYQARLDPDRIPYPVRVFVSGYSSDGTSCSIRVRVVGATVPTATTTSFTSTAPDWRPWTGAIKHKMFTFSYEQPTELIQVPGTVGSMTPSQSVITPITIQVEDPSWLRTSLPKLVISGLYVAEYVGGY